MKQEIKQRMEQIKRGEVPEGFRATEVGIIPSEWDDKYTACDFFDFYGSLSASREQLSDVGYCYLHYGDIHKSSKYYINVKDEFKSIPKLNMALSKVPKTALICDGDIVFVDASEDYEGTSRHVVIDNPTNIPFIAGLHTIVGRSKNAMLDNGYKRYCFQSSVVKKQFYTYANGIKVYGLSRSSIEKIRLPFPTNPEQEKIAKVLSTWDKAIELKESLIKKLNTRKYDLMRTLLSPKADWELVRLGDIGCFLGSSVDKKVYESQKPVNLLNYMDVYKTPIIDNGFNGYMQCSASDNQIEQFTLEYGDILFTPSSETAKDIGHSSVFLSTRKDILFSYHLIRFRLKKKMDDKFKGYIFNTYELLKQFYEKAVGPIRFVLSAKQFSQCYLSIPKTLQEQEHIANILSTTDIEIELNKQELEKLKQQKKALMQLLLTGIIRVN